MLWLLVPVAYGLWLEWTRNRWKRLSLFPKKYALEEEALLPSVSILVPARNEADRIAYVLRDLIEQDYPESLVQILVINDHSEDGTVEVVQKIGSERVSCYSLDQAYGKKAALAYGVSWATGSWIITVDADVRMGRQWLRALMTTAQNPEIHALAGPVAYYLPDNPKVLEALVALDNAGMQGLTAVGIETGHWILANGANLAFRRSTVESMGGYHTQPGISSGDDVLLLQNIHNTMPGSLSYVLSPNAMVWTEPPANWKVFWDQRLRWAGKSNAYPHHGLKYVQALAWLTSAQAMVSLLLMPWYGPAPLVMTWALKGLADFRWLQSTAPWYGAGAALRNFVLLAPIQWCYLFVIGIAALLQWPVQWKGRPVQHSEKN